MNKELILEIKQIIQFYKLDIDLNLSDDLLIQAFENFQNQVFWWNISKYQKLSEKFIKKFKDKVDWIGISINVNLSEEIFEKFQDNLSWLYFSEYQKLSENFIEKFQNKVNWISISIYQKLSEEFILKNWHRLYHQLIIEYQESLTPAFLCWLYRTDQKREYDLLKNKNDDFLKYAQKIEEEVKIVLIEII